MWIFSQKRTMCTRHSIEDSRRVKLKRTWEAQIILDMETNLLGVGTLKRKGVKLDILQDPLVLSCDMHHIPIFTDVSRINKLDVVLSRDEIFHNTMTHDENSGHRKMRHCNKRALNYLTKSPTTGA